MPVEVKSTSRLKAMLIAPAVLLVGLVIIFGIKYLIPQSSEQETRSVMVEQPSTAK